MAQGGNKWSFSRGTQVHRGGRVQGQLGLEAEILDCGLRALPPCFAPGRGAEGPECLVLVFQKLIR